VGVGQGVREAELGGGGGGGGGGMQAELNRWAGFPARGADEGVAGEGGASGEVERVGRQMRYLGDVDADLAGTD